MGQLPTTAFSRTHTGPAFCGYFFSLSSCPPPFKGGRWKHENCACLIAFGLMTTPGLSQTKPDGQTLQQILDELRAIHRDVRANATTQLLLAELQLTQISLDMAAQRRDTLRSEVTRLQGDEKAAQAEVARTEEAAARTMEVVQRAQLAYKLDHLKDGLTRIYRNRAWRSGGVAGCGKPSEN